MAETIDTQCVVVGGGIVGLAIARQLAASGTGVILIEREKKIGTATSSRSNDVIHAGIFYRPGGPQAILCRRGAELLLEYCRLRNVEHALIGKLVVATDEESVGWLEEMRERSSTNGAPDVTMLTGATAASLEPLLRCRAALYSPTTGIVDTHGLMSCIADDAEASGALISLNTTYLAAHLTPEGFEIEAVVSDREQIRVRCSKLVNAAGIWASDVAKRIDGMDRNSVPRVFLAKGAFFAFRGRCPFGRLIVPEPKTWRQGGIFTRDLGGSGRFGPDEQWVQNVDYNVENWPLEHVYKAVRAYFPELPSASLRADYAGIRPRLNGPETEPADWLFQCATDHHVPGLINLFGIESPGITASLAVAELVQEILVRDALPPGAEWRGAGT